MPTLVLTNPQSIRNKRDELFSRIYNQREFKDSCIIAFSETWLKMDDPDEAFEPDGFKIFRCDRKYQDKGKSVGGGVSALVNDRWCSDTKILGSGCCKDLEYLSIKCRPFYLPRGIGCCVITIAYAPIFSAYSKKKSRKFPVKTDERS